MSRVTDSVAVLGAGVAGLAAAKTLKQYGFRVAVFEAGPGLGGVWANNYKSLRVLEPHVVYGYPDWPWPADSELFPPAREVRAYLTSYARHYDVFDRIQFNKRIFQASPSESGGWLIEAGNADKRESGEFDYFVMAPGMFNLKKIPDWPGRDSFSGEVIHSSEFHDKELVDNKDVVIVGFSRSAMDVAVDVVDHAKSVTVVHRSVRWPVPEKILGLIRNHALLFSRWPTWFAPPWIRPGRVAELLQGKGAALSRGFWKFFEVLLNAQFRLRSLNLVPDHSIGEDLFTNLYVAPRLFFKRLRNGQIRSERSAISSLDTSGIHLESGKTVPADVVISATGWKHDYSFMPPDLLARIHDEDGMHLYRHMIHPDLPGFAFIGGVQGINSATCYAIQATWIARALTGELPLPSAAEQLDEIEALKAWTEGFVSKRPNRSQILNLHQMPYVDELMTDMGLEKRRKFTLFDSFVPYRSADYRDVTETVYAQ